MRLRKPPRVTRRSPRSNDAAPTFRVDNEVWSKAVAALRVPQWMGVGMGVSKQAKRWAMVAWAAAMGIALSLLLSAPASARTYKVGPVRIEATVAQDGSVLVTEERTFAFSGSYNGIYWDVPQGTYEGRDIRATIRQVSATAKAGETGLAQAASGTAGTYQQEDEDDCVHLTIHWPSQDEQVVFSVTYELSGLCARWSDTAELYWQYVPADKEAEVAWSDVRLTLHLPVPSGEPVQPGKNVRAWGHGPLDSTVEFAGNDVVFTSPGVGTAEYLEAHVTFSPSWLPDAPVRNQAHLQSVLDEEAAWANAANAQRRNARLVHYGIPALAVLISILCPLLSWLYEKWVRRRMPKAHFDDTYYREVPSDDHPAVLGMLYRGGRSTGADFTASLMRLVDEGRLSMRQVSRSKLGKHGASSKELDLELTVGSVPHASTGAKDASRAIDDATMAFLFDGVSAELDGGSDALVGQRSMCVSQLERLSQKKPRVYRNACEAWANALTEVYQGRGFAGEKTVTPGLLMGWMGLCEIGFAVLLVIVGWLFDVSNGVLAFAFIVCSISGIGCIYACDLSDIPVLSQDAVELRAKLGALRRWLTDFTRLEEAIPTDVVLWNRLLVMATALGVAQEVLRQLRKVQPNLFADGDFLGRAWGDFELDERQLPLTFAERTYDQAWDKSAKRLEHYVSTSSAATSRDSSSSGSDGGFSGRGSGGGGFSGGGRGGAF